jgi:lysophospholipase L1-like esterase
VAGGVALFFANAAAPDESRWLGVALAALGVWGAVVPRGRAARAVEAAASTSLLLLGGEWAVRRENAAAQARFEGRMIHFVDDPELRYHWKPNAECGVGTTNDLGMLDVPRETPKPAGVLRVACLGDSVGGDCELPAENACAQLEKVLETELARPVEVLNFSVPGYNTLQEARALELRAAPFEPDAAVVLYVINDPYPELAISHHLPGTLKFEHLLASGLKLAAAKLSGDRLDPLGGLLSTLYDDPRAWDGVVVRGFERLAAVSKARGIPVVVAVFPLFLPPRAEHQAVYARVAKEAEAHGLAAVRLDQAAYADAPLRDLLKPSRDMIHPNAHAHRLAAEAIARTLVPLLPKKAAP